MAILIKVKYKDAKDHHPSVMRAVIDYCLQPQKTETSENVFATSGQNCTPDFAYREFMANKAAWKKNDGLCFRHYIQSFHPSEKISPEDANKIGLEFASKAWPGYGVLVSTHVDRQHIHNHFVIDVVNVETGKKLHENRGNIANLRAINDEVCEAHGLSVLSPYSKKSDAKSLSSREYRAGIKRNSWKFRLRSAIKRAMESSLTREEFIANMQALGYDVRWQSNRKNITYTCLKEPKYKNGAYRKCNDDKLSDEKYLKENMEYEFRIRQEILAGRDHGYEPTDAARTRPGGTDFRGGMGNHHAGTQADADPRGQGVSTEDSGRIRDENAERNGAQVDAKAERDGEGFHAEADRNLHRTGWESERESCFKNRKTHASGRPFMGTSSRPHGTSHRPGFRLGSLPGVAPLSDDTGKTPEEIEAEERARIAASNVGALIGAGILLADALTNNQPNEPDDEPFDIKM